MGNINEIIGRALLALDKSGGMYVGKDDYGVTLDGNWTFEDIGATVAKALSEAGYAVQYVGKNCAVCGIGPNLACARADCPQRTNRLTFIPHP
jgi:hypothetical protein